jgi:hypothetical protein
MVSFTAVVFLAALVFFAVAAFVVSSTFLVVVFLVAVDFFSAMAVMVFVFCGSGKFIETTEAVRMLLFYSLVSLPIKSLQI